MNRKLLAAVAAVSIASIPEIACEEDAQKRQSANTIVNLHEAKYIATSIHARCIDLLVDPSSTQRKDSVWDFEYVRRDTMRIKLQVCRCAPVFPAHHIGPLPVLCVYGEEGPSENFSLGDFSQMLVSSSNQRPSSADGGAQPVTSVQIEGNPTTISYPEKFDINLKANNCSMVAKNKDIPFDFLACDAFAKEVTELINDIHSRGKLKKAAEEKTAKENPYLNVP